MPRLLGLLLPLLLAACAMQDPAIRAAADAELVRRPADYANGQARAWLVSKDGRVRGLLWGSFHTGYTADTMLPAAIRARFYTAADLSVEIVPDRMRGALASLARTIHAANRDRDPAAIAALDAPTQQAVRQLPDDLSLRGLSAVVAARAAAVPDPTGPPTVGFVDANLIAFARQQDRPVHALERVELVDATLDAPNGTAAADQLRRSLRRAAGYQQFVRWTLSAYGRGDVAGAVAALVAWQSAPEDLRDNDAARPALFVRRNAAWLPRLESRFAQPGEHFVAVGAGHLLGSDGLVALLRRDGYQVTPCLEDRC